MTRSRVLGGLVGVALTASAMASGGLWLEEGDATEFIPGQATVGFGNLAFISGALGSDIDVDLYCIRIVDEANFSATAVGGATFDTQMWLFDADGFGISFDDDSQSTLQSTLTSLFVRLNGVYILGISGYDNDARDAANAAIWADTPFGTERAPDGPGRLNPLNNWDHSGFDSGSYRISLTGASYWIPSPSSLALLGLGGLTASTRRRRA